MDVVSKVIEHYEVVKFEVLSFLWMTTIGSQFMEGYPNWVSLGLPFMEFSLSIFL